MKEETKIVEKFKESLPGLSSIYIFQIGNPSYVVSKSRVVIKFRVKRESDTLWIYPL